MAKLGRRGMTVALYGRGAENWKIVLDNPDIVTGDNLNAVKEKLAAMNIDASRITVFSSKSGKVSPETIRQAGMDQVVSGGLGTLAAAKVVAEAVDSAEIYQALNVLADKMVNAGVVNKQVVIDAKALLMAKLEAETADMAQVVVDNEAAESANLIRLEATEFAARV
jgi:hypothetical protein